MRKLKMSSPIRRLLWLFVIAGILAIPVRFFWCLDRDCRFVMGAGRGNIAYVRARLDAGELPDGPRWQDSTALQQAAYSGDAAIVGLLLDRGANPQKGLRIAQGKGHTDIVEMLKRAGAKE